MAGDYAIVRQNLAAMGQLGCGPTAEALREAFLWLDQASFQSTARIPIFAARHWSPALERRAFSRFRTGQDNIEEVAVPRWYRRALPAELRALHEVLTLGRGALPSPPSPLSALVDTQGRARWRLVCRFGRYVLHSPPESGGDAMVYFGDDTLFLMAGARRLLASLAPPVKFLDLCCGGGGVGLALPAFQGAMVGVDINPAALELASLAAAAQGLGSYDYLCGEAASALEDGFDLIVGNPPTLPPDLGGRATLYATGSSSQFLDLLQRLLDALSPRGQALLTVFSTATGRGPSASDPLRDQLRALLAPRRGYSYTVRRQFPLGQNRWLRHVALEIAAAGKPEEKFADPASQGWQLPGLAWRRLP